MADVQQVAAVAAQWFETATREDGSSYVRVKDGAPQWVTDELVYPAHGDMFPDDWRYDVISSAVDWIAEGGDPDESSEFADGRVDLYTSARLSWLASHLSRPSYCDEAREEFGSEGLGITEQIGLGQYLEASEIFGLVARALEEIADSSDDEEEEEI